MLSKEQKERIEQSADTYSESFKTGKFFVDIRKQAFLVAATSEASRSHILEEALEFIVNNHVLGDDIWLRAHCAAALNKYRNAL